MKKFFNHISIFFLVLIIVGYGLEPVIDYGLHSLEGSVYAEWQDLVNGKINTDLIVMGSSRGVVSYDAMMIEKELGISSFNLSFNAGSYNLQQAKMNAYLISNKVPTVIFQNIDLAHLSKSEVIPFEQQFITSINSSNYLEIDKRLSGSLKDFRFKGISKYSIDSRRLKLSILNLLCLEPNYLRKTKGYHSVDKSYKPDTYNLARLNNSASVDMIYGLEETIKYYQQERFNNTVVYIIWAPEYEVRRKLNEELAQSVKEIIKSKIIGIENIKFIDLRNDEIGDDLKNYYDSFHLNATGSKIFTKKLISQFKQF
ncbi:hypothetical protein [Nonlabens ulvanivorans]|uniref:hypothetical protein n=1 Tax=Nonlabens ulvanivorans TaxID=906888 RepID=UPI00294240C2|nr:hypothetical protein [Nonlabens ulvanivorans]WOI23109.1 hypothetical protein R1T42_01420 [Nonlabens ulvanivorans]